MLYKATTSFTGLENMRRGEVKEIKNEAIVKDLLKAGYIEPVEEKSAKAPEKKDSKPKKAKA